MRVDRGLLVHGQMPSGFVKEFDNNHGPVVEGPVRGCRAVILGSQETVYTLSDYRAFPVTLVKAEVGWRDVKWRSATIMHSWKPHDYR